MHDNTDFTSLVGIATIPAPRGDVGKPNWIHAGQSGIKLRVKFGHIEMEKIARQRDSARVCCGLCHVPIQIFVHLVNPIVVTFIDVEVEDVDQWTWAAHVFCGL